MSNKILSQEEIDALLTSVSTGDEVAPSQGGKRKKISLYDFKHPNLISKEQMRLLDNIHEGLVRNFGVFLSAQLRTIVDIRLLAIDQIMYSEFVMSISPPGAIYVGNIDNPYSQLVLEMNPQMVIFIVERLFGGRGSVVSNTRPISVIEQKIMTRVVERVADEIGKNWAPVKEFRCEFTRFESNPEFVQIIPASEPVVVVSLEVKIHGNTTLMNICYPYMWISNIISRPEVQEKMIFGNKEATDDEQEQLVSNLFRTHIKLKAILGRSAISIGDFVNLKLGDVLQLDTSIDSSINVNANNRHLYHASVGRHGKNYAFQINHVLESEEEYED